MIKIKSFFIGILLLVIVFIMTGMVALLYRANERSNIKTYIFQMGNIAAQRIGELQSIDNMSQNDLRNKLITKYISEYFKVIPGDSNVTNRPILADLSKPDVFKYWQENEAKQISEMSNKKMFRMAKVTRIEMFDGNKDNIDYKAYINASNIYYTVYYNTYTWTQSNNMQTEPVVAPGVIQIEARFKPGLKERNEHKKKINIRKYLNSGKTPVGLFMLEVTHIGSKDI